METLINILKELPEIKEAEEQLNKGKCAVSIEGCTESSKAHVIATLSSDYKYTLIIEPNDAAVKQIQDDYRLFDKKLTTYPAKDMIFYRADIKGNELTCERMKTLRRIIENKPTTIVTTFDALMAMQVPFEVYRNNILDIAKGDTIDLKAISRKLTLMGYEKEYQVEAPGQFCIRGGILDIFELTEENPYRIELWGDDVDSVRSFDVLSQRSVEKLSSVTIYPASEIILTDEELHRGFSKIEKETEEYVKKMREKFLTEEAHRLEQEIKELREEVFEFKNITNLDAYLGYFYPETISFLEMFRSDDTVIFYDEPMRIEEQSKAVETEFKDSFEHRLQKGYILPGQMNILISVQNVLNKASAYKNIFLSQIGMSNSFEAQYLKPSLKVRLKVNPIQSYNNSFSTLIKDLQKYRKSEYRVLLLSGSRTRAERLAKDLLDNDLTAFYSQNPSHELKNREIETYFGHVSKGYEYPELKLAVISETDIFGLRHKSRKRRKIYNGQAIADFNELRVGDYVVHEFHGLGIYRGIEQIFVDGVTKDYIKIEYAAGASLYVLATALGALQKYASSDATAPKLNKLGSQEWSKTKEKVKLATEEIARDLVELYAARNSLSGYQYDKDTVWQKEFEEMFPFEETEDQLNAIEETKKDMESTKIMDRLICGDVGFGKTEVAIRAAFKAVQEGKQVVFLVPTTILAQQHFDNFKERMKDFPVRIELLSRFRTASEIKHTLSELKKGFVDIVIGTHRVLSKDVEFKDLGLLIIDEEQRFGVAHKEKIKKIRETVDVLTLTATPIPRTLHMSLIGIRDMSLLEEPPVDRQPIQTYVMEYDEEMVREAIMREISRGGQVYYVYNRVNNIDQITADISQLVPEAKVAFAHGQMSEKDLEYIMYQFINKEIDVLVSTTIIETGMDISNVNTMIVHDSDKLGLSQLYQLRGRVGRSSRTAYAFLMYKKDKYIKEEAEKRLSAIKEFTDLGSGYKIAMKDLEIRGAGNLLGKSQHGHMQAVGYDLYCKMLNEAVRTLKGQEVSEDFDTLVDLDVDAFIPAEYIVNEVQKLDIYKRIAGIETPQECEDIKEELMDRFGKIPASVDNLLRVSMVRVLAHKLYMTEIKAKDGIITFAVKKDAALNPDGVINLFEKHKELSFSNKSYHFMYPYRKTNIVESDSARVLQLCEKLLIDMEKELL